MDKLMITKNDLNALFFSEENNKLLHDRIIEEVHTKSNGDFSINKQSDIELVIVMRAIYLQHSINNSDHICDQVRHLNTLVLNYCVPIVIENISLYLNLLQDQQQVLFINNPVNVNLYKSLEKNIW